MVWLRRKDRRWCVAEEKTTLNGRWLLKITVEERVIALWWGCDIVEIVVGGMKELTFVDSKGDIYVLLQGDSERGVVWLYSLVFFSFGYFLFSPLPLILEWIIPIYRGWVRYVGSYWSQISAIESSGINPNHWCQAKAN